MSGYDEAEMMEKHGLDYADMMRLSSILDFVHKMDFDKVMSFMNDPKTEEYMKTNATDFNHTIVSDMLMELYSEFIDFKEKTMKILGKAQFEAGYEKSLNKDDPDEDEDINSP